MKKKQKILKCNNPNYRKEEKMTKKFDWSNFWDILTKIALGIIIIYLLLKVLNVIHSPPIADIIAVASAGYFFYRYSFKIDGIEKSINKLKKECPKFKE